MPTINSKHLSAIPGLYIKSKNKVNDALIQMDNVNTAPTTATGKYYLYVDGGVLKFDNGSSSTAITGAGAGALVPSWETLYLNDSTMALTTAAWTVTQAGNFGNLILTKAGTGAGVPLVINNAGTGYDLSITNTNAEAAGIELYTYANWSNGTSADVVMTWAMAGNSDNGTEREFGNIKLTATDATDGSEDGTFTFDTMVAGTSRTVFSLKQALVLFGYGAAATISSQGAYDLVLETNSGTNSSTMTITDGAAGNIAFALDTTGVVTISTGLQVGGTTPTASIFNVAGSAGAGTTGYGFKVNATTLTTGTALLVDSASTSSGLLLDLQLATTSVFSVSETGAVIIAGSETADIITVTKGDVNISDGSLTIVDDDAAVSLSVTNDSATTLGAAADTGVVLIHGELLSTGTLLELSLDETSLAGGYYLRCFGQDDAANFAGVFNVGEYGITTITTKGQVGSLIIANTGATTSDVVSITSTAQTTGDLVYLAQTAETFAAGELLKIENTENGNATATPKTGNVVSITSSVTQTTADATFDYDNMLISRSDISNNAGFTLTSQGSTLKVLHTSTQTAGTLTDTSVVLEVEHSGTTGYTGTVAQFTGVAVGAKTVSVVSASTTVDDVLIAGSGVKADNKATLQVTNSGATAAGGSTLRVIDTGTPAAATSYLVDFDRAGATMTNNPVLAYMNNKDSTAAVLQLTTSGASAGGMLELNSTTGGALGAVLKFSHIPGANAEAAGDVVSRIIFSGQDDADAAEEYGRIDCVLRDAAAAGPDGALVFYTDKAGTDTRILTLGWDDIGAATLNGILVGDNAATAYVSSLGNFDLVLKTGNATTGSITLTDGASGDIAITPNGVGQVQLTAPTYGQITAGADGAALLSVAMTGLYTIGNTAGRALTLPAVATSAGVWYTIKKTSADAFAITITPADGLIDGAATNTEIDAQYDSMTIVCDGSNWHIVSKKIAA
jgi:hypothetical protein